VTVPVFNLTLWISRGEMPRRPGGVVETLNGYLRKYVGEFVECEHREGGDLLTAEVKGLDLDEFLDVFHHTSWRQPGGSRLIVSGPGYLEVFIPGVSLALDDRYR